MQHFKAFLIECLPDDATQVENSHKFLYPSILNEIAIYEDSQKARYFSFFNSIYFKLVEITSGPVRRVPNRCKPYVVYDLYFSNVDEAEADISQALRGSSTLTLSNDNTFDSATVKAVFAEKGFWTWAKIGDAKVFERYTLLYLLARSYNIFAERMLHTVAEAYDAREFKNMIQLREEILAFGVKGFYTNPVLFDRHELRNAWGVLSQVYETAEIHEEMKLQVEDLSGLISAKREAGIEKFLLVISILIAIFGVLITLI